MNHSLKDQIRSATQGITIYQQNQENTFWHPTEAGQRSFVNIYMYIYIYIHIYIYVYIYICIYIYLRDIFDPNNIFLIPCPVYMVV